MSINEHLVGWFGMLALQMYIRRFNGMPLVNAQALFNQQDEGITRGKKVVVLVENTC